MASINVINRQLKNVNKLLVDAYNAQTTEPIPAIFLRQVLTYVGMKEGFRFADGFLTLTQDVNPDFEEPKYQNDKTVLTNVTKAKPIYGTSYLLHDRPLQKVESSGLFGFRQEKLQSKSDYSYGGRLITNVEENRLEMNPALPVTYRPAVVATIASQPLSSFLGNSFCGREVQGEYPHRYFSSGAPLSVYRMAEDLEGKEGPFGAFYSSMEAIMPGYDPLGGIKYTDKVKVAETVSTVYQVLATGTIAGAIDRPTVITSGIVSGLLDSETGDTVPGSGPIAPTLAAGNGIILTYDSDTNTFTYSAEADSDVVVEQSKTSLALAIIGF